MTRRSRYGDEGSSPLDLRELREAVRKAKAEYHERRKLAEADEHAMLSAAVNDSVVALRAAQEA